MIACVPLTALFFAPCIERAVSRSSRFLSLPLQRPLADPLFYRFATILRKELLFFQTTLLRAGAEDAGAQKNRGICVFL